MYEKDKIKKLDVKDSRFEQTVYSNKNSNQKVTECYMNIKQRKENSFKIEKIIRISRGDR